MVMASHNHKQEEAVHTTEPYLDDHLTSCLGDHLASYLVKHVLGKAHNLLVADRMLD